MGGRGCHKPPEGLKGKALRDWMLEKSGAVETLIRLSRGRPIQLRGPTGKVRWHHPSASEVMWAVERILRKALPDLAGLTLSGDADSPVKIEASRAHGLENRDHELARRLCLAIGIPFKAPETPADEPNSGRPIGQVNGHNGAAALPSPTATMPCDQPGEVTPAIGVAVSIKDDVTITRLSHDGRSDGGGDWKIERGKEELRTVKGVTQEGVARVAEALIEELSGECVSHIRKGAAHSSADAVVALSSATYI